MKKLINYDYGTKCDWRPLNIFEHFHSVHRVDIFPSFDSPRKRILSINFNLINCFELWAVSSTPFENFSLFSRLLLSSDGKLERWETWKTPRSNFSSPYNRWKVHKKLQKNIFMILNQIKQCKRIFLAVLTYFLRAWCIKSFQLSVDLRGEIVSIECLNGEKQKRKLNYFMTKESCLLSLVLPFRRRS